MRQNDLIRMNCYSGKTPKQPNFASAKLIKQTPVFLQAQFPSDDLEFLRLPLMFVESLRVLYQLLVSFGFLLWFIHVRGALPWQRIFP